jgi:hypothetical protein
MRMPELPVPAYIASPHWYIPMWKSILICLSMERVQPLLNLIRFPPGIINFGLAEPIFETRPFREAIRNILPEMTDSRNQKTIWLGRSWEEVGTFFERLARDLTPIVGEENVYRFLEWGNCVVELEAKSHQLRRLAVVLDSISCHYTDDGMTADFSKPDLTLFTIARLYHQNFHAAFDASCHAENQPNDDWDLYAIRSYNSFPHQPIEDLTECSLHPLAFLNSIVEYFAVAELIPLLRRIFTEDELMTAVVKLMPERHAKYSDGMRWVFRL